MTTLTYPPLVELTRSRPGARLHIGVVEFDQQTGVAVRAYVLSQQTEHVADKVMERRYADMTRLMAGNVRTDQPDTNPGA